MRKRNIGVLSSDGGGGGGGEALGHILMFPCRFPSRKGRGQHDHNSLLVLEAPFPPPHPPLPLSFNDLYLGYRDIKLDKRYFGSKIDPGLGRKVVSRLVQTTRPGRRRGRCPTTNISRVRPSSMGWEQAVRGNDGTDCVEWTLMHAIPSAAQNKKKT